MGEDRRPNVAGKDATDGGDERPQPRPDDLERDAKLLRSRESVDGHEPPPRDDGEKRG